MRMWSCSHVHLRCSETQGGAALRCCCCTPPPCSPRARAHGRSGGAPVGDALRLALRAQLGATRHPPPSPSHPLAPRPTRRAGPPASPPLGSADMFGGAPAPHPKAPCAPSAAGRLLHGARRTPTPSCHAKRPPASVVARPPRVAPLARDRPSRGDAATRNGDAEPQAGPKRHRRVAKRAVSRAAPRPSPVPARPSPCG
eukprot:364567-Chlamydomonas_euryale.AAC.7